MNASATAPAVTSQCETASNELLIDFVDRWASATPDAIAVRYGASVWTWAQWSERIGRLAGARNLSHARGI